MSIFAFEGISATGAGGHDASTRIQRPLHGRDVLLYATHQFSSIAICAGRRTTTNVRRDLDGKSIEAEQFDDLAANFGLVVANEAAGEEQSFSSASSDAVPRPERFSRIIGEVPMRSYMRKRGHDRVTRLEVRDHVCKR